MKLIPKFERKIWARFCGALLLVSLPLLFQCSTAVAQQWEEQDWQRASGNVNQFQNSFPDQNPQPVQTAAFQAQPTGEVFQPANVQHADHQQALPQPLRDLNTLDSTQLTWQGEESGDFKSESGPLKWTKDIQKKFGSVDIKKVVSSLAIVLGGYFGFVWLTRKLSGDSDSGLPNEVFEVIGTSSLNPKQNLQLVRLGSKLLVLVSGDEGASSVAEVTDPDEVEYLMGLCNHRKTGRSSSGGGNNATVFRRALDRARSEGSTTEAAMDKVIRKLSDLAGKTNRTDLEA